MTEPAGSAKSIASEPAVDVGVGDGLAQRARRRRRARPRGVGRVVDREGRGLPCRREQRSASQRCGDENGQSWHEDAAWTAHRMLPPSARFSDPSEPNSRLVVSEDSFHPPGDRPVSWLAGVLSASIAALTWVAILLGARCAARREGAARERTRVSALALRARARLVSGHGERRRPARSPRTAGQPEAHPPRAQGRRGRCVSLRPESRGRAPPARPARGDHRASRRSRFSPRRCRTSAATGTSSPTRSLPARSCGRSAS